jgi:hypothetical protein
MKHLGENMTVINTVRITDDGFYCEKCGVKASATPGATMVVYMREVITFESAHKPCGSAKKAEISPLVGAVRNKNPLT